MLILTSGQLLSDTNNATIQFDNNNSAKWTYILHEKIHNFNLPLYISVTYKHLQSTWPMLMHSSKGYLIRHCVHLNEKQKDKKQLESIRVNVTWWIWHVAWDIQSHLTGVTTWGNTPTPAPYRCICYLSPDQWQASARKCHQDTLYICIAVSVLIVDKLHFLTAYETVCSHSPRSLIVTH